MRTPAASETAMLFIPGSAPSRFRTIDRWPGRSFIVDLEDSVPPGQKEEARRLVADLVADAGQRAAIHVRVNPVPTALFGDDVSAAVRPGLAGLVLPKVESADHVRHADDLVGGAELAAGLEPGTVRLMATVETVAGLEALPEIASASPRLTRLAFGAGDFALDVGLDWPDPEGLSPTIVHAKIQTVLASRAAGLEPPHDGAFTAYRDAEGLRAEATGARRLGFAGKHVIHPDQIPVVEEVFRPTPAKVDRARRIIEAFTEAERRGQGAVGVDGELVDEAIVRRARRLLADAGE